LKRHTFISCFACVLVLGLATLSYGQAIPTASRVGSIQLGVGGFLANPDYAQTKIKGLTFYGDFDFTQHLSVEGEIHYSIITPSDVSEDTYVAGPRYVVRHKKFQGYAKALFGIGRFGLQVGSNANPSTGTYIEYVLGGGVEYQATRKINVRLFDFEMQKWPGFAPNGLTPFAGTIGVAYVFH
jgi:hypothetical protein